MKKTTNCCKKSQIKYCPHFDSRKIHSPFLKIWVLLFVSYLFGNIASAQVSLKKFDNPSIRGYESIVFEYDEATPSAPGQTSHSKVTKEFNIEENNPFNKLSLTIKELKPSGRKSYIINPSQVREIIPQMNEYITDLPKDAQLNAGGYYAVDVKSEGAVLAYNLLISDLEGYTVERTSSILILSKEGKIINKIEQIPSDIYSIEISNDGNYLFYASGDMRGHSINPNSGLVRIININDMSIFYEFEVNSINGFFSTKDQIAINAWTTEGHFIYFFDEIEGKLYRIEKDRVILSLGSMRAISNSLDTLGIKDYTLIK